PEQPQCRGEEAFAGQALSIAVVVEFLELGLTADLLHGLDEGALQQWLVGGRIGKAHRLVPGFLIFFPASALAGHLPFPAILSDAHAAHASDFSGGSVENRTHGGLEMLNVQTLWSPWNWFSRE